VLVEILFYKHGAIQLSLVQAERSLLTLPCVWGSEQRAVLRLAGSMNWWWCDYRARNSDPLGCFKVI